MTRPWACLAMLILTAGCASPDPSHQKNEIIAHALDATVQLFTERAAGVKRAGSGVVVATDDAADEALVLTAAHLVHPLEEQTVYALAPDREQRLPGTIVAVDPEVDLALIKIDGLSGTAVAVRSEAALGDAVWVVAFPWGRARTVVSGVVSQVDNQPPSITGPLRLIDASVSYGMSGGGVFSRETGDLLALVRGYRSAQLAFPGTDSGKLTLPVAGETTVVPVPAIACFLQSAAPAGAPLPRGLAVRGDSCG